MSGTCQNIYGSFRSSYTNHGCRHFWIPPVVDASISGYIQDVANCGCRHLVRLLIMQPIPKCLTIVPDYLISNDPRDITRGYQLSHRQRNSIGRHGDSEKRTAPLRKASQADNKYHTYKSTEESNWPPPEREL